MGNRKMKIISTKLFTILIIAIILLSTVAESRNNKKKNNKKTTKKHRFNSESQQLNRLASEAATMIMSKKFDRENDPFLKELKNQQKFLTTANSTQKWFLIKCVLGKSLQILGAKDADVHTSIKQFDEKNQLKAWDILLKFQKSMNLDDMKPLVTDWTTKGLSVKSLSPDKRTPLLTFLNLYVRQSRK